MNGNEGFIIVLATVSVPLLLYFYFLMPNDKNCNDCGTELSPHRQKTYHCKFKNVDKEICKRCYTRRFGR